MPIWSKWRAAAFAMLAGVLLGLAAARRADAYLPAVQATEEYDGPTGRPRSLLVILLGRSTRRVCGIGFGRPAMVSVGAGKSAARHHSPPSPGALEPLSAAVLKRRVIEIFPIVYSTLMAIIQGAAFGLLFLSVVPQFLNHAWSLDTATLLTQAFATGLTLVIVTHEYLLLVMVGRWVPTVLDTLIPYLLGFGEIWMAMAAGHSASWWTALSALCVVAVFAFWHTRARITKDSFGNDEDLYAHNRHAITVQIALCAIMLISSMTVALLNWQHVCPKPLNIGLTCGVTFIGIVVLAWGERNQNLFYDRYFLPRWRPLKQRQKLSHM